MAEKWKLSISFSNEEYRQEAMVHIIKECTYQKKYTYVASFLLEYTAGQKDQFETASLVGQKYWIAC